MSIICQHVHRLELRKSFTFWIAVATSQDVPKTPCISYSCISYFGHVCLKLNIFCISLLNDKWATQNVKTLRNSSLWTC